jgi:alpha-mannosidase
MKRRDLLKSLTMAAGGSLYSESAWKLAYAQVTSKVDPKLVTPVRALVRRDGSLFQPLKITIEQQGAGAVAAIKVDGVEKDRRTLQSGPNTFELYLKPATEIQSSTVSLEINGAVRTETVELKPVRQMLIYILPHSHHDLGYTDLQGNVEEKQILNITRGIELARKTAGYPEGSRFVWNLEVLWGADLYMKRGSEEAKSALIEAVQKGWVGLNGAYANELTGLCRAEELLQLFYYSTQLGKMCRASPGEWCRQCHRRASSISPPRPTISIVSVPSWSPGRTSPSGGFLHRGKKRFSFGCLGPAMPCPM